MKMYSYLLLLVVFASCKKDDSENTPTTPTTTALDTTGMVAYYPFSGNAKDATPYHNDGTVLGATLTTDRKGNAQSAYSFNGTSNYIKVPYSTSLDIRRDFSISVWVRPDTNVVNPSYGPNSFIFYQTDNQSGFDPFYLSYSLPNNNMMFGTDRTGTVATQLLPSFRSYFRNVWVHVAGTWNTNTKTLKLYTNGELVGQMTAAGGEITYATNAFATYIGSVEGATFYKGVIDELRVYRREISQQEVIDLMAD